MANDNTAPHQTDLTAHDANIPSPAQQLSHEGNDRNIQVPVSGQLAHYDSAAALLPGMHIDNTGNHQAPGFWSNLTSSASSTFSSLETKAENFGTQVSQGASDLVSSAEEKTMQGAQWVAEHPGYAMGALVGGVVAVVCSPVELTAAGVIGVGIAGAAAIDGAVYLAQRELS